MAGRKISDHSFWAGSAEKGGVFPKEAKMRQYHSTEGSGAIQDYPDTTEGIQRDQAHGDSKIKGHKMKTGYRY